MTYGDPLEENFFIDMNNTRLDEEDLTDVEYVHVPLRKADFIAIVYGIRNTSSTDTNRTALLARVDWAEVGMPMTVVEDWYNNYVAKNQKKIRKEALAKLTDKEKKVLGL